VAGKVTVGLASHRPCVTDFSGLSSYGLTAWEREMGTPPTLIMGYGTPFLDDKKFHHVGTKPLHIVTFTQQKEISYINIFISDLQPSCKYNNVVSISHNLTSAL